MPDDSFTCTVCWVRKYCTQLPWTVIKLKKNQPLERSNMEDKFHRVRDVTISGMNCNGLDTSNSLHSLRLGTNEHIGFIAMLLQDESLGQRLLPHHGWASQIKWLLISFPLYGPSWGRRGAFACLWIAQDDLFTPSFGCFEQLPLRPFLFIFFFFNADQAGSRKWGASVE